MKGETAGFSNAFCNKPLPSVSYISLSFDTETAPKIYLSHHASCRNTALRKNFCPLTLVEVYQPLVQHLLWSGLIPITRNPHALAPGLSLVHLHLHTQWLRFAHCTHEALPKAWRTQTGSQCLRCSPRPVFAIRGHGQPGLKLPRRVAILKQPRD